MKSILTIFCILILHLSSVAQYTTPNTGQLYKLSDLVAASAGVVTGDTGYYTINNDLTISSNDTFLIDSTTKIFMAQGVLITSLGHLNLNDVKGSHFIDFIPLTPGQSYRGLRIENDNNSILKRVFFIEAGGIRLLNADINIEQCGFSYFDQSHSTGVINLFQSSPYISNCLFQANLGPALSSGANVFSAPKIFNSIIENNNTSNSNAPQINLGPSGSNDTIIIKGNRIQGNNFNTMVGGISTSNLLGTGQQNVLIDSNLIENNRYGITCTGSNVNAVITRNSILNNNNQNSPNLGGSGINFNGTSSNTAIVGNNEISGNLWGITIQGTAVPNLGEASVANSGNNCFSDNQNGGVIYALYNNTPGPIDAQLNSWDDPNPENVIFHDVDDGNLGLVDFSNYQIGLDSIVADFAYLLINDTLYIEDLSYGSNLIYSWDFGNNSLNGIQEPVILVTNYPLNVELTIRGACNQASISKMIDTICSFDVQYPGITHSIDTANSEVSFMSTVIGDTLAYSWDFGDGNTSSNENPIHTYANSGDYLVQLVVLNVCGDTLTFTDSVNIPQLNNIGIEGKSQRLKIWPNPSRGSFSVESDNIRELTIHNLEGQLIYSIEQPKSNSFDIPKIESGLYILSIRDSAGMDSRTLINFVD